jgi:peroxiredoxin
MKNIKTICALALAGLLWGGRAWAAKVGDAAPDFKATDTDGKVRTLKDYNGKYVVLEWTNKDCPFVKKHYDSQNMQNLQKEYTGKGVVWLTIISSHKGKQGFVTAQEANQTKAKWNATPTAILLDAKGKMARLYGAKTTPHMFVINPKGTLIYAGAIDDQATTDPKDLATAKNYVRAALDADMAGKPVADPLTKPYGCSVKY